MDAHALRWSLLWSEVFFSTTGLVNIERGSFNLPGETLFLTFYVRLASFVEGTCTVRLRQGMESNTEFSGGCLFSTLSFQDDSDYRSLVAGNAGGGANFTTAHNMLAISNPHWTVRLSAGLGPGLTADFTYEVWGTGIVTE